VLRNPFLRRRRRKTSGGGGGARRSIVVVYVVIENAPASSSFVSGVGVAFPQEIVVPRHDDDDDFVMSKRDSLEIAKQKCFKSASKLCRRRFERDDFFLAKIYGKPISSFLNP
jgi:hypothetical protein